MRWNFNRREKLTIGGWGTLLTAERRGRLKTDTLGRVVMRSDRPDMTRVEGRSVLTAHMPSGSLVTAEGYIWLTHTGQIMSGRVTLDGQLLFDKQWRL